MKNIFVVVVTEEDGKYYAIADTIHTGQNIIPIMQRYKDAVIIHLCETRRQADDLAFAWNNDYKRNGTYLFG